MYDGEEESPNLSVVTTSTSIQKQSSRGVLKKRCSENIQQIYRRTPMPNCDFSKVLWYLKKFYEGLRKDSFLVTAFGALSSIENVWKTF